MPKKILVADDSPTVRNVAESLLRKHGYELFLADDGAKALNIAKLDKPDLVLLDNSMPVLSGEKVCKELKQSESLKNIPVIMLLSRDEIRKERELRLIGADAFMVKPFSPADLLEQVENLLQTKEVSPSVEMDKASPSLAVSSSKNIPEKNSTTANENEIGKTTTPGKKGKQTEGLDILETSDLMENFELSVPSSEGAGVHGFEWFLSELQKEAQVEIKTDSSSEEKLLFPKKKVPDLPAESKDIAERKEERRIHEIDVPEKGYEDFIKDLKSDLEPPDKEKAIKVKPQTAEEVSLSQLDNWFSDLKERVSERIAQEMTKNISPKFLEKIIREEIAKLKKNPF